MHLPETVAAPRPDVDLGGLIPDPAQDARWPLAMGTHPVLEPSFDIAGALAEPGVSWIELCGRGVQHRHLAARQELIEYLRAWCSAAQHDEGDALYRLGQLRSSMTNGIAAAIPRDAANILAARGHADGVETLLAKSQLGELAVVDLLAASFYELGRNSDAFAMNELAIAMDQVPTDATRCHRLVRGIVVGTPTDRHSFAIALHASVAPNDSRRPVDATCVALDDEMQCWLDPRTGCDRQIADPVNRSLVHAYAAWPEDGAYAAWFEVVSYSVDARTTEAAYQLAIPALELALRTSRCDYDAVHDLAVQVERLYGLAPKPLQARFDAIAARIIEIDEMTTLQCEQTILRLPPLLP